MTLNDVIALANAGYTRTEIAELIKAQAATPAPEPAAPAPVPAPAPAPAQEQPQTVEQVLAAINGLKASIQQSNMQSAQQTVAPAPTPEQILANIINPPELGDTKEGR